MTDHRKRISRARALASVVAAAILACTVPHAAQAREQKPNGDQLLARATAAPQLRSYAVPVEFAVRLHKPVGLRARVEGTAYYQAPAQTALAITKAGGIVGGFFKGTYQLDVVPQAWPAKYHVVAVTRGTAGGSPVILLNAKPRTGSTDVTGVVFTLTTPALHPVDVVWTYRDGSTIQLSSTFASVGAYSLPQESHITVDMPRYHLEADATYGNYALNTPVPEDVFTAAK